MAMNVKIDVNGNSYSGDKVNVREGDKVTLSAVTPPPGAAAVDGTWKREKEALKPAKDDAGENQAGKVEITVGKNTAGKHIFISRANTADRTEVTLELVGESGDEGRSSFWKGTGAVFGVLGTFSVLVGIALFVPPTDKFHVARSIVVGILTIAAMLALADVAGRVTASKSGLPALVKGADQRASTSKIQYLVWTLLLGFVLALVAAYAGLTEGSTFQCGGGTTSFCIPGEEATWTPYLILLGVPAATAAVAKGIVSTKVSNGVLQKTEAQQPSLADVATNDAGNADLVDIQYLVFNLIAFVYVGAYFATNQTLPRVPDLLLGLTSAAAATYVLNKSMLNNKPTITSVTPSAIKPGDVLTVKGENLLVKDSEGKTPQTLSAKVAGIAATATVVEEPGSRYLKVQVPEGIATSTQTTPTVTVVTTANIETDGYPISFVPITVLGWSQTATQTRAPAAGTDNAKLTVTGLPKKLELDEADWKTVRVIIGGMDSPGELTDDNEVTFKVPDGLATGETETKVAFQGRTSAVAKIPIA
jgi:hypothetical protein